MKLKHQSDRTLESFKVFPYVVWGVTIVFAVFVYNIAVELKETADKLQAQAEFLQTQTRQVDNLDLERY